MTATLRLTLLTVLAIFFSHSRGYASTTVLTYTYDSGRYVHIDRNIGPEDRKLSYDSEPNPLNPADNLQANPAGEK